MKKNHKFTFDGGFACHRADRFFCAGDGNKI